MGGAEGDLRVMRHAKRKLRGHGVEKSRTLITVRYQWRRGDLQGHVAGEDRPGTGGTASAWCATALSINISRLALLRVSKAPGPLTASVNKRTPEARSPALKAAREGSSRRLKAPITSAPSGVPARRLPAGGSVTASERTSSGCWAAKNGAANAPRCQTACKIDPPGAGFSRRAHPSRWI